MDDTHTKPTAPTAPAVTALRCSRCNGPADRAGACESDCEVTAPMLLDAIARRDSPARPCQIAPEFLTSLLGMGLVVVTDDQIHVTPAGHNYLDQIAREVWAARLSKLWWAHTAAATKAANYGIAALGAFGYAAILCRFLYERVASAFGTSAGVAVSLAFAALATLGIGHLARRHLAHRAEANALDAQANDLHGAGWRERPRAPSVPTTVPNSTDNESTQ